MVRSDLTGVNHSEQQGTFMYDSLKRLIAVANPDYQKRFQASYVVLPDGTIIKYDIHDQTTVMK